MLNGLLIRMHMVKVIILNKIRGSKKKKLACTVIARLCSERINYIIFDKLLNHPIDNK